MNGADLFVEHGKAGTPLTDVFVADVHCHLGQTRDLRLLESSAESLVHSMDLLGVDVAAPSSLAACLGGLDVQGNDEVIDAVQRYPDRIFGYMVANPYYPKAAERELQRCLRAGMRGIKVHTHVHPRYDDPGYDLVWEFAAEHGLPVLAHTWGEQISQLEPHFTRYPAVTWLLAHSGVADRESYSRVARQHPNVFLETCYSGSPRGLIEYFVREGLEDKVLWGSDTSFLSMAPQFGRVLFAKITPTQKAKILGLNARRVLQL